MWLCFLLSTCIIRFCILIQMVNFDFRGEYCEKSKICKWKKSSNDECLRRFVERRVYLTNPKYVKLDGHNSGPFPNLPHKQAYLWHSLMQANFQELVHSIIPNVCDKNNHHEAISSGFANVRVILWNSRSPSNLFSTTQRESWEKAKGEIEVWSSLSRERDKDFYVSRTILMICSRQGPIKFLALFAIIRTSQIALRGSYVNRGTQIWAPWEIFGSFTERGKVK